MTWTFGKRASSATAGQLGGGTATLAVRAQGEVVEHDLELRDRLEDLDEPRVVGRMEVRPEHQVLGGEPGEEAGIGVEIEEAHAVCARRFDAAAKIRARQGSWTRIARKVSGLASRHSVT